MTKNRVWAFMAFLLIGLMLIAGGCVERELTIKTVPAGGIVTLNDEEIGEAPVTVSFNWYGDYKVRISKEGYETLSTHQKLDRPWYDVFPFDFFAEVLWPGTIRDKYQWSFNLKPFSEPTREELLNDANQLRQEALSRPQ